MKRIRIIKNDYGKIIKVPQTMDRESAVYAIKDLFQDWIEQYSELKPWEPDEPIEDAEWEELLTPVRDILWRIK